MSVKGSRSDASTGGSTALMTAIAAATTIDAAGSRSVTPGSSAAATYSEAAESSQPSATCSGRNRGRAGSHRTGAP